MKRALERYLVTGEAVEIIYADRDGQLSQRTIQVHSVGELVVKAYCHERQGIRSFSINNILAAVPAANRRAG